jgi:hypothetical protein
MLVRLVNADLHLVAVRGFVRARHEGILLLWWRFLDAVQHVKKAVASASRNPSYFAKASHVFFTITLGSVRKRKLMDSRGTWARTYHIIADVHIEMFDVYKFFFV